MRISGDKSLPSGLRRFWERLAGFGHQERPRILFEGDSPFHHVIVSERGGIRTMHLGPEANEAETAMMVADPEKPVFEYPGMMMVSLALGPSRNILMLGLGGGFIPGLFQRHLEDRKLTVVEIDPLVAELAGVWFGFNPGGNVKLAIQDGFDFVAQSPPESYDQIWLDAFGGQYIPERLASEDFLRLCRLRLAQGGVLVQNLHQTSNGYFGQLRQTKAVFGAEPILLGGVRSANTIAISFGQGGPAAPMEPGELVSKVKAFRNKIGAYDLIDELRKVYHEPSAFRSKAEDPSEPFWR